MNKEVTRASAIVHWPNGPVLCCPEHSAKLQAVASILGAYVRVEPFNGDEPCSNCLNEAKTKPVDGRTDMSREEIASDDLPEPAQTDQSSDF